MELSCTSQTGDPTSRVKFSDSSFEFNPFARANGAWVNLVPKAFVTLVQRNGHPWCWPKGLQPLGTRLRLVKKHCLRMLWLIGRVDQAGRTLHFIWVSMYLHRQDRHFTWSSEPPEGVAISGQRPYHQFPFSLSPWVLVPPRENRALSLPLCKTSVLPGWANPAAVRQECFYGEKLARKGGRPYHHKRMTQLGASPF